MFHTCISHPPNLHQISPLHLKSYTTSLTTLQQETVLLFSKYSIFNQVIGTAENDHLTINLQGYASPAGEVRMWLVRTIIATVSTMFNNYNTQQAWILALTSWYLTYVMIRKAPHFNFRINCLKAALYSVLLWSTSISILLIYGGKAAAAAATYVSRL